MKRLSLFAIGFLLVSSCSSPPKQTLSGTIVFVKAPFSYEGEPCNAPEGYEDIKTGSQIVIKDASGKIVATGLLGQGKTTPKPLTDDQRKKMQDPQVAQHLNGRVPSLCNFPFTVENIPYSDFYTLELDNDRRGQLTFKADELEQKGWDVTLTMDSES